MTEGTTAKPNHFLVTGGAGFLGINLVRFLLERGHQVTSLDIAEFDYPEMRAQVRVITGDIRDPVAVTRAMEGVDIVVHTAAALPLYKTEDIYSTDIDGTRNVSQSALSQGVERVIHVSSTAVYGIPDHHPLLEDDPTARRRPLWRGQGRCRGGLQRLSQEGAVRPDPAAEVVRRAGAAGRVRAVLRLGAKMARTSR